MIDYNELKYPVSDYSYVETLTTLNGTYQISDFRAENIIKNIGTLFGHVKRVDGDIEYIHKVLAEKLYCFDTIQDVKNYTELKANELVMTFGYYEKGDLGNGLYRVINKPALMNMNHVIINDKLALEKVKTSNMARPIEFGYDPDKTEGYCNNVLNFILAEYDILELQNKEYPVELTGNAIRLNTNNKIIGNGATLKATNEHNLASYGMLYTIALDRVKNIEIHDLTINCNKGINTATKGEHGHGIKLFSVENALIKDCHIMNCFGDGIYYGTDDEDDNINFKANILIDNCLIENCRRNGISIIHCENATIKNCEIHDIKGTSPQAGIDLEPNTPFQKLNNVTIEKCTMWGNASMDICLFRTDPQVESYYEASNINIKDNKFGMSTNNVYLTFNSATNTNLFMENNSFRASQNTCVGLINHTMNNNTIIKNNIITDFKCPSSVKQAPVKIDNERKVGDMGNINLETYFYGAVIDNPHYIALFDNAKLIKNVKIKTNTQYVYGTHRMVEGCEIKNDKTIIMPYAEPLNYYEYYNELFLKGNNQGIKYYIKPMDNTLEYTFTASSDTDSASPVVVEMQGGYKIFPFNAKTIKTVTPYSSITFKVLYGQYAVVTKSVGTWTNVA